MSTTHTTHPHGLGRPLGESVCLLGRLCLGRLKYDCLAVAIKVQFHFIPEHAFISLRRVAKAEDERAVQHTGAGAAGALRNSQHRIRLKARLCAPSVAIAGMVMDRVRHSPEGNRVATQSAGAHGKGRKRRHTAAHKARRPLKDHKVGDPAPRHAVGKSLIWGRRGGR